ncbi:hypothetical protein J2S72_000001 [Peptoniphilus koenoeneniae]|uniref:Copper amine oxidase-like N-terminal domain-containing protein n=1 Tax=Peptoniphilus koenoeneniae TaxID=507751 RepID=A0ABU0ASK3_9FIRM|nr:copper amine oxidase N-terminal domain-containing protein [Peptoniphilus koenoeneniae]MDQ0274005.1 hypothetical protein [Peptoniphilus koenoeneniae]
MNKRILKLILIPVLIFSIIEKTYGEDNQQFKITVNKNKIQMNQNSGYPYIAKGNRTMVPLRVVSENMGFKVDWKSETQEITMTNSGLGRNLNLQIGNTKASLNGKEINIDQTGIIAPIIRGDRTYVPLRFIAENMGYKVDYKKENNLHQIAIYLANQSNQAKGDLSEDQLLNLTFKRIKERYETWDRPGDNSAIVSGRIASRPVKGEYPGKVSDKWVAPDLWLNYCDPWNNDFFTKTIAPWAFQLNNHNDFKNAPDDWQMAIELIDQRFSPYIKHIDAKKLGHQYIKDGKCVGKSGKIHDSGFAGDYLKEWAKDTYAVAGLEDLFVGNPENYNFLKTKGKDELLAPAMGDLIRYKLIVREGEEEHAYEFDVRYMFLTTEKTLNRITDPAIRAAIKTHFQGNGNYKNNNRGLGSEIFNIKQLY